MHRNRTSDRRPDSPGHLDRRSGSLEVPDDHSHHSTDRNVSPDLPDPRPDGPPEEWGSAPPVSALLLLPPPQPPLSATSFRRFTTRTPRLSATPARSPCVLSGSGGRGPTPASPDSHAPTPGRTPPGDPRAPRHAGRQALDGRAVLVHARPHRVPAVGLDVYGVMIASPLRTGRVRERSSSSVRSYSSSRRGSPSDVANRTGARRR